MTSSTPPTQSDDDRRPRESWAEQVERDPVSVLRLIDGGEYVPFSTRLALEMRGLFDMNSATYGITLAGRQMLAAAWEETPVGKARANAAEYGARLRAEGRDHTLSNWLGAEAKVSEMESLYAQAVTAIEEMRSALEVDSDWPAHHLLGAISEAIGIANNALKERG